MSFEHYTRITYHNSWLRSFHWYSVLRRKFVGHLYRCSNICVQNLTNCTLKVWHARHARNTCHSNHWRKVLARGARVGDSSIQRKQNKTKQKLYFFFEEKKNFRFRAWRWLFLSPKHIALFLHQFDTFHICNEYLWILTFHPEYICVHHNCHFHHIWVAA